MNLTYINLSNDTLSVEFKVGAARFNIALGKTQSQEISNMVANKIYEMYPSLVHVKKEYLE